MERYKQTINELKPKLSEIESDWKDEFASKVIRQLTVIEKHKLVNKEILQMLFEDNYDVAITIVRLFLEKSKDEFTTILKQQIFNDFERVGKTLYNNSPDLFIERLSMLNIIEVINNAISRPYTWNDIIIERLKSGRGSAIKGQARGRLLEDFVEKIIKEVFQNNYDSRCNFTGEEGKYFAKADFAIPNKTNPSIVIEVKAYGATGSKQTDSLGDIEKIIKIKRHDTYFLFVTDGITWLERESDLRKIVQFQNKGYIYRIYTQKMIEELKIDLRKLKNELGI